MPIAHKTIVHRLAASLLSLTIASGVIIAEPTTQLHAQTTSTVNAAAELMPPDMGQTNLEVFVPETGHSLNGFMLDYWRVNGSASVYGNPISEPFGYSNGLYSQAFERGVFQFSPDWMWTEDTAIRLAPVGQETVQHDRMAERSDGRRVAGDRRSTAWRSGSEDIDRAAEVQSEGGRWDQTTGYSISGIFGEWYDSHEGWFYLGAPVSEPHMERGVTVQYFRNGVLMLQDGEVTPAPLPREHPERFGIDTTPVEQGERPVYDESLFYSTMNPYGVDPTHLTGQRRIDVNITEQTMRVYQGNTLVLETLISTGLEPNHTEIGNFHIRMKFLEQTMNGFTSDTGEVVGLGEDGEVQGTQTANSYSVEDVPNVMYINADAEALHGAYWHDNFGQRMSHGCINQPLDVAAFMYEFAPLGTPVNVFE